MADTARTAGFRFNGDGGVVTDRGVRVQALDEIHKKRNERWREPFFKRGFQKESKDEVGLFVRLPSLSSPIEIGKKFSGLVIKGCSDSKLSCSNNRRKEDL